MLISIEGNIGSGKTTLIREIQKLGRNDLRLIEEPVREWQESGLLRDYYQNPSKYAYEFQTTALTAFSNYDNNFKINVQERSVLSAYHIFTQAAAEAGHISERQVRQLKKILDAQQSCSKPIDAILLLNVPPEQALQRIVKRGRAEESSISIEYLNTLNRLHLDLISKCRSQGIVCEIRSEITAAEFVSWALSVAKHSPSFQ